MRPYRIPVLGLFIALTLLLAACSPNEPTPLVVDTAPPEPSATPSLTPTRPPPTATPVPPTATEDLSAQIVAPWEGSWEGIWFNETFRSTGTVNVELTFSPDGTGEIVIDVGGMVFGLIDPQPATWPLTFDGNGMVIDVPADPVFGDVTVTINADGSFEMSGDMVPQAGIGSVSATGLLSNGMIEGDYTVTFVGGSGADGFFTLKNE